LAAGIERLGFASVIGRDDRAAGAAARQCPLLPMAFAL